MPGERKRVAMRRVEKAHFGVSMIAVNNSASNIFATSSDAVLTAVNTILLVACTACLTWCTMELTTVSLIKTGKYGE